MWFVGKSIILFLFTSVFLYSHGASVSKTSIFHETINNCDCGYDGKCVFINGEKACRCKDGFQEINGMCIECDCGSHGECNFLDGVKACECELGFKEKDGICTACDCGLRGSCRFDSSGEKICDCYSGYAPYDGDCFECDCGPNGKCSRETGLKRCICDVNYSEKKEKCEYCSCGENSKSCRYNVLGEKECNCSSGYAQNRGYCEECNCGPYGSCIIEYDRKRCNCKSFAVEKNGVCVGIETTSTEGTSPAETTSIPLTTQYCNCGEYSKSCRYDWFGSKICVCFPGFVQRFGTCEECNCGPYGSCSFLNDHKTCKCRPSYVEINGVCVEIGTSSEGTTDSISTSSIVSSTVQECDCGPRGRCTWEYGQKKCICDEFTSEVDGKCVDCYCGKNSKSCHFNWNGDKICNCSSGYSQYFGFCYECNCGLNAKSCYYRKNGTKVCVCDFTYTQINGYCSAICSEDKCVHGKCEVIGNSFRCRCNEGFTGQRCDDKIQFKSRKPDVWKIMLFVTVFAIFILLTVMLCILGRMKNKMFKK